MLVLVIILLALAVLVLPMRHAFGVNLAATFLFIVPNGFDVTTYLFILLFFRLSILKFWAKENFKFDQFIILFLFFLFCSILSYLIYQGEGGLEYLRRFFMTILIIFLFVNIYNSTKEIDLFVRYLFIGMLLLSIHLISQTLIPINPFAEATFSRREGRLLPRGFANQYVNSNNMGALLVWGYGIVIGFYTLFYSKYIEKYSRIKKTKVFLYGSVLFMMVALLLGMLGSRTNFIVLILVGLVVLLKISVTKRFVRIVFFSFIFFSCATKPPVQESQTIKPPENPQQIKAVSGHLSIEISWKNISSEDFDGIMIRKSSTYYPKDTNSGLLLKEGFISSVIDTNVETGVVYYYTVFTKNKSGRYSSGSYINASAYEVMLVRNFSATRQSSSVVRLSWDFPLFDVDFKGITIIKNTNHYPKDINDGIEVCTSDSKFCDDNNANNPIIYYSAFSYDKKNNFSRTSIQATSKEWINQIGTSGLDKASDIVLDNNGNIYITGETELKLSTFVGDQHHGSGDIFIAKYKPNGDVDWIRQFGSTDWESGQSISINSNNEIFVVGTTLGDINGAQGSSDFFIAKIDSDGNNLQVIQEGTALTDEATSVTIDQNNSVYVTGFTQGNLHSEQNNGSADLFIIKYDSSLNREWTKLYGSDKGEIATGIVTNSESKIYITGYTTGDFGRVNQGEYDVFVICANADGTPSWIDQRGTSNYDYSFGINIDQNNNVYVTGNTLANLDGNSNNGGADYFIIKYNEFGQYRWTRQRGSVASDVGYNTFADSQGNIYVVGSTRGNLDNNENIGNSDAFIAKFESDNGDWMWTKQFGSNVDDIAKAIFIDSKDSIYIVGDTMGDIAGTLGMDDIFIRVF